MNEIKEYTEKIFEDIKHIDENGNENDNSSVIYTELNNHKFLFMGYARVEVKKDMIKNIIYSDINVLKVGNHGSRTRSS